MCNYKRGEINDKNNSDNVEISDRDCKRPLMYIVNVMDYNHVVRFGVHIAKKRATLYSE